MAPAAPRVSRPAAGRGRHAATKARARKPAPGTLHAITAASELEAVRAQLARVAGQAAPVRWNAEPDDVQRSVLRLVLTLVEFVRKLLERQAIRRMEGGTLTEAETEDVGRALMALEATVRDLTRQFGLEPADLNLDLGPLGTLM